MYNVSMSIDGILDITKCKTKEDFNKRLQIIKAGGLKYVDTDIAWRMILNKLPLDKELVKTAAEAFIENEIIVYQQHAPVFGGLNIEAGKCKCEISDEEKNKLEFTFWSAAIFGTKNLVFHPIQPYPEHNEKFLGIYRSFNIEFFNKAIEFAHKYDINICLENMPYTPDYCSNPIELKELHDTLNDKYVKYCLDTGHAHISGYDVADVVKILGSDIAVLHIQDNFGNCDGHCLPPFGSIDWQDFALALKEIKYNGTINFEVHGDRMKYMLDDEMKVAYIKYAVEAGKYISRLITS